MPFRDLDLGRRRRRWGGLYGNDEARCWRALVATMRTNHNVVPYGWRDERWSVVRRRQHLRRLVLFPLRLLLQFLRFCLLQLTNRRRHEIGRRQGVDNDGRHALVQSGIGTWRRRWRRRLAFLVFWWRRWRLADYDRSDELSPLHDERRRQRCGWPRAARSGLTRRCCCC